MAGRIPVTGGRRMAPGHGPFVGTTQPVTVAVRSPQAATLSSSPATRRGLRDHRGRTSEKGNGRQARRRIDCRPGHLCRIGGGPLADGDHCRLRSALRQFEQRTSWDRRESQGKARRPSSPAAVVSGGERSSCRAVPAPAEVAVPDFPTPVTSAVAAAKRDEGCRHVRSRAGGAPRAAMWIRWADECFCAHYHTAPGRGADLLPVPGADQRRSEQQRRRGAVLAAAGAADAADAMTSSDVAQPLTYGGREIVLPPVQVEEITRQVNAATHSMPSIALGRLSSRSGATAVRRTAGNLQPDERSGDRNASVLTQCGNRLDPQARARRA